MNLSEYKVVILAAGLGTRLRPLTNTIPKVMLPIEGTVPLLEHTFRLMRSQGFRRFIVNFHYFPEAITSYFGDGRKFNIEIEYSDESKELLETGGALKKMESKLTDTFLLVYGDHVHFFDFRPVLAFHQKMKALGTLVLKKTDHPQNGDVAEIDPSTKKIIRWHHRPHAIHELGESYLLNTGLDIFSKRILDYIPEHRPVRLDHEVLPPLIQKGEPFYGWPTDEFILDIGTPEKYAYAKEWYARMKIKHEKQSPVS